MIPTTNTTIESLEKLKVQGNPNSTCHECGKQTGKRFNMQTMKFESIFLYRDVRGFMVCNLCKEKGLLMQRKKMTKAEKKRFKKMKREMNAALHLPHVTLDREGKVVE